MPLIQLKTKLTSLKFGNDMPGGGNSGLPFVKYPIDNSSAPLPIRQLYKQTRTGLDYPSRGGAQIDLGSLTGSPAAMIDKDRISKFMNSKPRGAAFINKQIGLQLSNPKSQTGDTIYTLRAGIIPSLIENTRVYNKGKNTLAQVAVNGTGTHLTRAGILPYNPLDKFYSDVVGSELSMTQDEVKDSNRLLILQALKMNQSSTSNQINRLSEVKNIVTVNKLGISLNRNILFQYLGGPDSVYGVGSTTIKRSADTTKAADVELPNGQPMSALAMTYSQLMEQEKTPLNSSGSLYSGYFDFRDIVDTNNLGISGINKIKRQPNSQWTNDTKIDIRFFDGRVDKMNKLSAFTTDVSNNPWDNKPEVQDIIKFVFECLSNDTISQSTALFFRAYLTSITDNNSGQWNSYKYMGRGENFYVYQGFERSISFGFKIGLGSRDEMDATYDKLNNLISQVYPDYSANGYMRAPIIKLTIGDYLNRVPGFLESVNVTIDQTSPWEIDDGAQLPHVLDVSVSFKPIMDQLPRRVKGIGRGSYPDLIRQDYKAKQKEALLKIAASTIVI